MTACGVDIAAIGRADQPAELARNLVVVAFGQDPFGDGELPLQGCVAGVGRQFLPQRLDLAACRRRLADPRAAVDDDSVANAMLGQQQFRLEIVEQKALAANIVARNKIEVLLRQPIARAVQDRLDATQRVGIFLNRFGDLPRQSVRAAGAGGRARVSWVSDPPVN